MHVRSLGRTGIMVSPLGLGTVALGRTEGLKYPKPVRIPTDDQVRALLRRARDLGVNLIDTAPAYGAAEERLGSLRPGRREDWVIVTKAGEEYYQRYDFSPESIARSVERSLTRLAPTTSTPCCSIPTASSSPARPRTRHTMPSPCSGGEAWCGRSAPRRRRKPERFARSTGATW